MSTRAQRNLEKGSSMVEFALVGIPLIFILISIFEISRGMWMYETVAHAVREGARYAAVHGQDCTTSPNQCDAKFSDIAARIRDGGVGLDPDQLNITITTAAGAGAGTYASKGPSTLTTLLADNSSFSGWTFGSPAGPATGAGTDVIVTGVFPFRSALAMFWPGSSNMSFSTVNLGATSRERIAF